MNGIGDNVYLCESKIIDIYIIINLYILVYTEINVVASE